MFELTESASTAEDLVSTTPGGVSTIQITSTTVAAASLRLAIVWDSQANALAANLPDGIGEVFPEVINGSLDGT